ncbi:hypothetical protein [Haloarchaeobius sp. TZWSO28]|uniref:DUF7856 family protein n=1 Tax=Haloarchaeobius sp. TZWSO28 TaxID=3446119 RepID=UPI003EB6FB53
MRIAGDGWVRTGRAVDLRDRPVEPTAVVAAIAGEPTHELTVEAPTPGPVHQHVAHLGPNTGFSRRQALAAVARERGFEPPQAGALERVEDALAEPATQTIDLQHARRQVAEVSATEERLRERVATLQGELRARRDVGSPVAETQEALQEALQALTDTETARIAAEQTLVQARQAARSNRDDRERRLRLEDRRDNLRREATAWLVRQLDAEVRTALDAVPGAPEPAAGARAVAETDQLSAALAVVRLASLDAPVVLSTDRFASAEDAARVLDAPVVIV